MKFTDHEKLLLAERFFSEGMKLYQQCEYELAIAQFTLSTGNDPKHSLAWLYRGNSFEYLALKKQEQFSDTFASKNEEIESLLNKALESFSTVLNLDAKNAAAVFASGRIYANLGNYTAALKAFQTATNLDQAYQTSYQNFRAQFQQRFNIDLNQYLLLPSIHNPQNQNNMRDTMLHLSTTTEQYNIAEQFFTQGNFYYNKKNFDWAIDLFNSCLEYNPKHIKALLYRGISYEFKANIRYDDLCNFPPFSVQRRETEDLFNLALDDFDAVIKLEPRNSQAIYARGCIYAKLGAFDSAGKNFQTAINLDDGYFHIYQIFRSCFLQRHCTDLNNYFPKTETLPPISEFLANIPIDNRYRSFQPAPSTPSSSEGVESYANTPVQRNAK